MPDSSPLHNIQNDLQSPELNVIAAQDPAVITLYQETVASALNAAGQVIDGARQQRVITEMVQDIIIETSAQGASVLEVHLIDPGWALLVSGFIDADDDGLLSPPVDMVFPPNSNCIWRLVGMRATADLSGGNLILTFEDIIVSLLRDMDAHTPGAGVNFSHNGETLTGWMQRLIDATNKVMKPSIPIQLVEWISIKDPNYAPPTLPFNGAAPHAPKTHYQKKGGQTATDPGITNLQQLAAIERQIAERKQAAIDLLNRGGLDPMTGHINIVPGRGSYIPGLGVFQGGDG